MLNRDPCHLSVDTSELREVQLLSLPHPPPLRSKPETMQSPVGTRMGNMTMPQCIHAHHCSQTQQRRRCGGGTSSTSSSSSSGSIALRTPHGSSRRAHCCATSNSSRSSTEHQQQQKQQHGAHAAAAAAPPPPGGPLSRRSTLLAATCGAAGAAALLDPLLRPARASKLGGAVDSAWEVGLQALLCVLNRWFICCWYSWGTAMSLLSQTQAAMLTCSSSSPSPPPLNRDIGHGWRPRRPVFPRSVSWDVGRGEHVRSNDLTAPAVDQTVVTAG
jgi:hypothetical protein